MRPKYVHATAGQAIEKGQIVHFKNNREQPQWPDDAFQKAKAWADNLAIMIDDPTQLNSPGGVLYNEVRAEERRRESQVCGAESEPNEYGVPSVCQVTGPHSRHRETLTTPTGNATTYWYGPPQCDRPHMTEAAQRVIEAARDAANHEHIMSRPNCLCCRLGEVLSEYDREARS